MPKLANSFRSSSISGVPQTRDVVAHVGVAAVDHRRRTAVIHGPIGGLRAAVLKADIHEPFGAERQTHVTGESVVHTATADAVARAADGTARARVAVVLVEVLAGAELHAAPGAGVLQLEVDDAGNGVGTVLRGRAVAQHLDLPQSDGGYGGQIRPLRPVGNTIAQPGDYGRAVAALAVDEDQRVVRGHVAQVGRPHDGGRVADGLGVDVERGGQRAHQVGHVGGSLIDEIRAADHVDGNHRFGARPRFGTSPDHDQFGLHEDRQREGNSTLGFLHQVFQHLEVGSDDHDRVRRCAEIAKLCGPGFVGRLLLGSDQYRSPNYGGG